MFGDVEVQNAPAIMSDHKEAIQHTEAESGDGKEVHGGNHFAMVGQKRLPTVCSGLASWEHAASSATRFSRTSRIRVSTIRREYGEHPTWILGHHLKNEFTHFFADAFAASSWRERQHQNWRKPSR
jgi:hypothetical protein